MAHFEPQSTGRVVDGMVDIGKASLNVGRISISMGLIMVQFLLLDYGSIFTPQGDDEGDEYYAKVGGHGCACDANMICQHNRI